jgi:hypothetical protein
MKKEIGGQCEANLCDVLFERTKCFNFNTALEKMKEGVIVSRFFVKKELCICNYRRLGDNSCFPRPIICEIIGIDAIPYNVTQEDIFAEDWCVLGSPLIPLNKVKKGV